MKDARYYEDFEIGERVVSNGYTFTESSIIEFALKYDPQPIHVDIEAARKSIYGGLIASGWHSGSVAFRLFYDTGFIAGGSLGSNGVQSLKWLKPVRPGDTIRTEVEVLEKRVSSRGDRGYVNIVFQIFNQTDELLIEMYSTQIMRLREAAG